ncbi:MAG: hypothetical protein JWN71_982 [Xanthobacteraceae bacterium]|jgi:hypothetical protein|nr:hypothetical protein [Xanthobacteraceae bacterium]
MNKRIWAWGRWPWVTTVVTFGLAVSPIGQAFISGAFSSEALSRNIARPILIGAGLVLIVAGLLEAWIWWMVNRRRG